jgi:alpha-L-rhamnosidase
MVENIGGIRSDGPAYKHIVIAPVRDPRLSSARTAYDSIRGPIASAVSSDETGLTNLEVAIPANTTATVSVPLPRGRTLTESGRPLSEAEDVKVSSTTEDRVVLEVGSGTYRFDTAPR